MRYLIYIIVISFVFSSCSGGGSTDVPEPLCEEGGTEVEMNE